MKRVLYANDSSYGGISFIADDVPGAETLLAMEVRKDFDAMIHNKTYTREKQKAADMLNECEHLVVFSGYSLKHFVNSVMALSKKRSIKEFKKVSVVLSDSHYVKYYQHWNDFIIENGLDVLIMPDVSHLLDSKINYRYYYQHIPDPKISPIKKPGYIIVHSPGLKAQTNLKGTKEIRAILGRYDLRILHGLTWDECLREKAEAHICIDQIVDREMYKGGLGKSGLEGMMLRCLTITSGNIPDTKKDFPTPPVLLATAKSLRKIVDYYYDHEDERADAAQKQHEWVKKYTSKEFVINNICQGQ